MLFNSYTFLVFFAVVLILHNLPFSWKTKKNQSPAGELCILCRLESAVYFTIMAFHAGRFFVGRALYTQENKHKKKLLLVVSLIAISVCFATLNTEVLFRKFYSPGQFAGSKLSSCETKYHTAGRYLFLYIHHIVLYH